MSSESNDREKAPAKLGPYKRAVKQAIERAGNERIDEGDWVLHQYPDYETYKDVQTSGNKAKLRMQFVKESHIEILSAYINANLGPVEFGLCHGTRRGLEQKWFKEHLSGTPDIIGTEISDTAKDFPDTVQWDFHERNPEWSGRADFLYSNSWDHAYDPRKAFGAWLETLRDGGLLVLDYTKGQTPESSNALDPFGISFERLRDFLVSEFGEIAEIVDVIDTRKTNKEYRSRTLVLQRKTTPSNGATTHG